MKGRFIFMNTLRAIMRRKLKKSFNITYHYNDEILKSMKPPYFVFGNHTIFFDPFIMDAGNKYHIAYVANDEYFRSKLFRWFMKRVGAVPKTKFVTDAKAVKNIYRLKQNNDAIGIYPEGGRTWPSRTQPILYPTAKLVNKFELPVIICLTQGAGLSAPRWAVNRRHGEVHVTYSLLFTAEDTKNLSIDEIFAKIEASLSHDEFEWQREKMIEFNGKKLAEKLEWFIYACPECGKLLTLKSENDIYCCQHCGFNVRYNKYGFFEDTKTGKPAKYDNVNTWNDYQVQLMAKYASKMEDGEILFSNPKSSLFIGDKDRPKFLSMFNGILLATKNGFTIKNNDKSIDFDYNLINGIQINHKNKLDFFYNNEKYRICFDEYDCGYIFEDFIKALKKVNVTETTKK